MYLFSNLSFKIPHEQSCHLNDLADLALLRGVLVHSVLVDNRSHSLPELLSGPRAHSCPLVVLYATTPCLQSSEAVNTFW